MDPRVPATCPARADPPTDVSWRAERHGDVLTPTVASRELGEAIADRHREAILAPQRLVGPIDFGGVVYQARRRVEPLPEQITAEIARRDARGCRPTQPLHLAGITCTEHVESIGDGCEPDGCGDCVAILAKRREVEVVGVRELHR